VRDDFPIDVKRALAERVNLRCSNPSCGAQTSGPQMNPAKALNIGVAAHVTAASPGGPDYDASLTKEERTAAPNGIWLCQNCAKLVDNDRQRFTARLLKHWKRVAEENARSSIGRQSPFDRGSAPHIRITDLTFSRTRIRYASKEKLSKDLRQYLADDLKDGQFELLADGTLSQNPLAVVAVGVNQGWDWKIIVMSAGERGWKRFATIDLPSQKGRIPKAILVPGSPSAVVLTYLEGSGTGVLHEATSWYRLAEGKLEPFLTIPTSFYVIGWGMPFDRRLTSKITSMPHALSAGAIVELEFTVEYTIAEVSGDAAAGQSLFSVEKLIALEWNEQEGVFVPRTPEDDLAEIEEMWTESTAGFIKRNRETLEHLAAAGTWEQQRFINQRLLRKPNHQSS